MPWKWPRCHSDKNNTHAEGFALGLPANPFLVPLALCSHLDFCSSFIQNAPSRDQSDRSTPADISDSEIYGRSQGKHCKITGAGQVWHLYNLWGRLSKPLISLGQPISHLRAISPSRRKSNIF